MDDSLVPGNPEEFDVWLAAGRARAIASRRRQGLPDEIPSEALHAIARQFVDSSLTELLMLRQPK
jgi:hypothetical protein